MTHKLRFAVIGGGIIGSAVGRRIQRQIPGAEVSLFEKEKRVADHQTGHNSGVVHAGLYYEPGGVKARLCRRGVRLLEEYLCDRDIPYDKCGKVVVALDKLEQQQLKTIHQYSVRNGVPEARMIGPEELREIEPNAVGIAALHSPTTAIIDYRRLTEHLVQDIVDAGGDVHFSAKVDTAESHASGVHLETSVGSFDADYTIVCAGLQSDRIARRSGAAKSPSIVPFFGQYMILEERFRSITNGLVYPVPDPKYPFLGVHLTKRVDGEMTVGPNAFLSLSREIYQGLGVNPRDFLSVVTDPGFWKFASRNLPGAAREIGGVVSPKRFIEQAARYVPAIAGAKATRAPRGIRAQALNRNGSLVDDFVIEQNGRVTFVRNAPSPGATSSLAIAENIVEQIIDRHDLPNFHRTEE